MLSYKTATSRCRKGGRKRNRKKKGEKEKGENEKIEERVKQKAGEPYGAGLSAEGKGRVINRGTGATEREECISQYRLMYHF